jgi:hypothetical protein
MKNFKQLIRELPSNKVVAAFGQFQPPTAGHEHLVKAVQSIANNGDHVIYASANEDKKLNPLPADRKVYFLQRMFSEGNFKSSEGITSIVEMASELSKKYKHLTVVTFADKVGEYEQQLKEHNGTMYQFDSIKVISAGDVDPDSNSVSVVSNVKMCESAKTGDFIQFKKGVPHTLTELDSRRLMNDVRKGMGLDPIRENVIFERTKIREQYVAGKIFNVGDRVKDENGVYEIMDRGANYITVVNESGELMKKWIDKVSPSRKKIEENLDTNPNEICFKNYTTANFNKDPRVFHAFKGTISKWEQGGIEDGVAVLNAIKHTDSYMSMVDGKDRTSEENKAKQALNRIGQYQSHNYWDDHKAITTDDVIAKNNADLQNAIAKVNVKEESEVMDSKKIAMRYKEFMKKAGSKEKSVDIAEPSSGKPMTVFKGEDADQANQKLKKQHPGKVGSYDYDVSEAVSTGPVVNVDKINHAGDKPHEEKFVKFKGVKPKQKTVELKPTNEESIAENAYEKSEENKRSADSAKKQGDMFAHHMHMSDHHENLSQWHYEKGRSNVADIHAKKSDDHHEKAMSLKEENINELSTDLLGKYKTAAGASAKAADQAGNYKKGDKRFSGINKATRKQFDNDLKKHDQVKESDASWAAAMEKQKENRLTTNDKKKLDQVRALLAKEKKPVKEDMYSSDTRTKKVQVQDKDGNWVFKDRKSHPHKINFGASRMNGKPDPQDPAKLDTATAYQKHLEKQAKDREKANEAWVLNPTGKSKKKYKDIKDNKTLSVSNTAPFDAFSNTNNQT